MGDMTKRGRPRSKCPSCPDCTHHNVVRYGSDKNNRLRYKCLDCNKTFNERKGTVFYRMRTSEKDIMEAMHSYLRCMNLSAIAEIKGVKIGTVINWIKKAAHVCIKVTRFFFKDLKLISMQLDEIWSYVKKKAHESWVWKALDPVTKLFLGFHIGPWTKKEAKCFIKKLRAIIERVDIITTDGLDHYLDVILSLFKEAMYARVVKTKKGKKLETVEIDVVAGDKELIEFNARLYGFGKTINTSYIERHNLTSRQDSSRLKRKTLAYSKTGEAMDDYMNMYHGYYNFVRRHKSLTKKRTKRTPAMAAGLTKHIWTMRDLLTFRE